MDWTRNRRRDHEGDAPDFESQSGQEGEEVELEFMASW